MQNIPVREFMQTEPVSAKAEMPLTELVALLRKHGYRALTVTDEKRRVVGVVSETDLFLKEHPVPFSTEKVPSLLGQVIDRAEIDQVDRCRKMTAGEVMTQRTVSVGEDATLEEVAFLMHERHLAMVPVVRDEVLVGVVRRSDILEILYRESA